MSITYIPNFIRSAEDMKSGDKVTAEKWNAVHNLLVTQGDKNSETINEIVDFLNNFDSTLKALMLEASGELAVGTTKAFVPAPFNIAITKVKAQVLTAPTGSDLIIDVNVNGTSIYTTQVNRPTIASGDTTVEATLPDNVSISENDMITIDIDQVGSTVAGASLAVTVIGIVVVAN